MVVTNGPIQNCYDGVTIADILQLRMEGILIVARRDGPLLAGEVLRYQDRQSVSSCLHIRLTGCNILPTFVALSTTTEHLFTLDNDKPVTKGGDIAGARLT